MCCNFRREVANGLVVVIVVEGDKARIRERILEGDSGVDGQCVRETEDKNPESLNEQVAAPLQTRLPRNVTMQV